MPRLVHMSDFSTTPAPPAEAVTLATVFGVLRRRRALLFWALLAALVAAALSCLFATPRYRATAEVQVQKEDGGAFGLESNVMGPGGAGGSADSLDYSLTLQTEAALLRSPALELSVIQTAHLESTPDYFGSRANSSLGRLLHAVRGYLPWHRPLEPLSVPLAAAPNRRYLAEKIFAGHLTVKPIAGTRLIEIAYADPDPARAALVANAITHALSDAVFQQRYTATVQGSAWLSSKLDALRTHTEVAQAKAAALQRGTGVFGNDASRNIVLERLDSLNQTLTAAESNRILKESIDRVAQSGSPELISSLSGNSSSGTVASINTSLSLIQGLRQQEAQIRAELAADGVRYGPAYPRVAELKAELLGVTSSIAAETRRLGERAHSDFEIAAAEEQGARTAFEHQKQLAATQNDAVINYEMARQEADGSRNLYEGLLAKLNQASLLEGLRANNISVVSAAQVPAPQHPSSPDIPLRFAAALGAGLIIGLGLIVLIELTDSSIHSAAQVEAILGVPLLAVLPAMEKQPRALGSGRRRAALTPGAAASAADTHALLPPRTPAALPVLERRLSAFSEGLRSLRTALQLSRAGGPPKVILITSSLAAEGKTTLAANLAALFAQSGARTLLVDADLRRPALHYYGETRSPIGLAMALSGPEHVAARQPIVALPNLSMLCGSELAPFPSELLGSPRMHELITEWRANYDVVILDAPPVLPVTDASLLARHSDALVLVARRGRTTRQALRRAVQALQATGCEDAPIGVVMNDVSRKSGSFFEYFGHNGEIYASDQA